MNKCGIIIGVVMATISATVNEVTSSPAPDVDKLLPGILDLVGGVYESGSTVFLDHDCNYSVNPSIRKWQLHYKGKFWCPGLAPFTGRSLKRSKAGAIELATRDFARQALQNGIFTKEELKIWL